MAGHNGSIATVSTGWRHFLALCLVLCGIVQASVGTPREVYNIDLPAQSVADALTSLSEQTGVSIVFPYDLVKGRTANPVVGRYTVLEALGVLLKDTGLLGGLSDKGVLVVSQTKSGTRKTGETLVTTPDTTQQHTSKTKPGVKPAIAAFFAAVAAAFSASAEEAADAGGDQAKMSSVIVTAEKREERQQDVPVAMTVLDPQNLAENGQNRLVDYFSTVPGLSISSNAYYGGNQYLTIRGLSAAATQNATVATVVDDVPAQTSLSLSFGNINAPDLDPSDLARIEVLKGPQGTLYGADSLGGLIKYVTIDPSTSGWSGRAEVGGVDIPGGGLGYAVRGAANIPLSDTFALRASAFDRRDPGYIDNLTTGQNNFNSSEAYGSHVAALWRPSQSFSIKLSALVQDVHGNNSLINSNSAGQFIQGDLKTTGVSGGASYSTQNQIYSATIKAQAGSLDIASVTGYVVNKSQLFGDATNAYMYYSNKYFQTPDTLTNTGYNTEKVSQELRISSSIGHWLDWRLGGFYTHEHSPTAVIAQELVLNPAFGANPGVLFNNTATTLTFTEYAAFADFVAHLTDRFDVEFGGRESWNKQAYQLLLTGPATVDFSGTMTQPPLLLPRYPSDSSAFTYLVTPKFVISPDLMAYARVATGYRIGGSNALSGSEFNAGVPATYQPDRTTNYELGIKGNLIGHRLSFDLAAYYIDWKKFQLDVTEIFRVGGGNVPYRYTTNAGNAKSEGVELSLEAHPVDGLTLTAEGAFDDAVLTQDLPPGSDAYALKGDRLPYSIRASGGLSVNQDIHLTNDWVGFVGGSVNYVGARPFEFTTRSPSGTPLARQEFPAYTKFDLRTGVRGNSLLINLYVNNVANKRGLVGLLQNYSLGSQAGWSTVVIQPRTIGLSLAKSF